MKAKFLPTGAEIFRRATPVALLMVLVLVVGGMAVASANPATPMPVIEGSAAGLCQVVDANPTPEGVMEAVGRVSDSPSVTDALDVAMVLITAVHHVCPQHEKLIMGVVEEFAYPDGIDKCKQEFA